MIKTLSKYRDLAIELSIWNKRNVVPAMILCFIQLVLAALDLAAVGLLALSIAIASSSLTRGAPGDFSAKFLDFFELQNQALQLQVSIIGGSAVLLLISKTLLSLAVFRMSLEFVRKRTNEQSSFLIFEFFRQEPAEILSLNKQKSIWTLTAGATSLSMGAYKFFLVIASDFILILVIFLGLAIVDLVTATLALVIFASTSSIAYGIINRRTVRISKQKQEADIDSAAKLQDILALFKELIVRNEQEVFVKDFVDTRLKFNSAVTRIQFFQSISKYLMEIVLVVCMTVLGIYVVLQNDVSRSIAIFTLFFAGSGRMLPAILRLQSSFLTVNAQVSGADETLRLMRRIRRNTSSRNRVSPPKTDRKVFLGKLEFKGVNFAFEDGKQIIKDLNFDISPGSYFGIVGFSGVGKSTLVDLTLGLRNPTNGEIRISDMNPRQAFTLFPGKISYVPQEIRVIGGSIIRNLTLGRHELDYETDWIQNLMTLVKLEDLVDRFGLNGSIGETDFFLSGGQRQRLGIARALVTRPDILILDEATSALDYETEAQILHKLRMIKNLTIVLVTHRVQTLKQADKILFMGKSGHHSVGNYDDLSKHISSKTARP